MENRVHRTMIILDKDFHKQLKLKAVHEGRSLSAIIRELLRKWLEEPTKEQK